LSVLASWCFRHRRLVLLAWILLLVGSLALSRAVGSDYATRFGLPDTPSARALSLLDRQFPAASGNTDQIVFSATSGSVLDSRVRLPITLMLEKVAVLPGVRAVNSPYRPAGSAQVSRDGKVAFATVVFDGQGPAVSKSDVKRVMATARSASSADVHVALGGQDIENASTPTSSSSTLFGILFALVVLGLAFGALFSAFLPVITALFAIGVGTALTGLLSHAFSVASFATILGVLIGLGVGVDYALFIVTRHRSALKAGASVEEATVKAVNTSGRAVFFAGITVCIALMGQFALGLPFLYGLASSASLTVLMTMVSALTLLPALLGFFGTRVLSRRERRRLADRGPEVEHESGFWSRWSAWIADHPRIPAVAALAVVVGVALPTLTLRIGLDDAGSDPPGSTTLQAYTMLSQGFGPGFSGPLLLVASLPRSGSAADFGRVVSEVGSQPGVAATGPVVTAPGGGVAIASVYPTTSPQSARTSALLDRLRSSVIPRAESGTGLDVLVGGQTAIQTDFAHVLSGKLPLFFATVVVLGFLLLMVVFRSLVVPLVASVMNLLSVGAALGVLNVVFEWGWAHSLFRIPERAPIEVFLPVMLISILFGLSMDYEVFLVSRMREEWVRHGDARGAVTVGQSATGRVITAAAAIMILVFGSFALGGNVVIKQFGIGLAAAIFIDAFVIRTVVVPAVMHLLGRVNWWLPGPLDRAIPQLNVEGIERNTQEPEEWPASDRDVPAPEAGATPPSGCASRRPSSAAASPPGAGPRSNRT
jgi:RND superfamily putative drug exporter